MKRYLIIGAGAIGASLAAQFELSGVPYRLFGRGEQIRHIQAHGIRYVRPDGTRTLKLQACSDRCELVLTQDDLLVFTPKTQDLERACMDWAWLPVYGNGPARTASELPVLTPQNGLAAERIALRWFGQVYGASVNTPARFTEVGQIVVGGYPEPGLVVVGRFPQGEDSQAAEIAADLCRAGYLAEAQPDILRWKAAKLINSVRNNALDLFEGPAGLLQAYATELAREAIAVFSAMGIAPARAQERRHRVSHWGIAPGCGIEPGQQSTWQSIARGSSHEVDFLNGEIVLLGRLHGVATPFNAAIQQGIGRLCQSGGAQGSSQQGIRLGQIDELMSSARELAAKPRA
ncbi:ketopantoate reductase family protein [Malikia sp.]|uniref:ketopantoate reductase family protein n=1 Tax=Malikia sp. TaxID=2070706 RepID=UPI002614B851|nr:2-dehydropantoate 2-reductase N-terminal domain-containing protein [Malikia sp.]MDD2728441.1 ketopantoate reductase C-terminal domain-containing protein [Malikia sp.]